MKKSKTIGKDILVRVRWLYVFFLLIAAAVVGRIVWIQYGPAGNELREMAEEVTFAQFVMPAARGDILARDGRILATTIPEYEIFMDFSALRQNIRQGIKQNREESVRLKMERDSFAVLADGLADSLSVFFGDRSKAEYSAMLFSNFDASNQYTRINRRKISYTEEKRLAQFPVFNLGKYKGGYIARQSSRRFMPMDPLSRSTIGTVRNDPDKENTIIISRGLEMGYDSLLRGTNGVTMKQKISGSFWIPVPDDANLEPVDGYDIVTTINADIQDVAESALREKLTESNAMWGVVILMEVATGEILAMCNLTRTESGGYGEVQNHAIGTPVEPGSTFKLATLLTLLEEGGMSINAMVDCVPENGLVANVGGKNVRDDHRSGVQSLRETFEQSSNIGFARSTYGLYSHAPARFVEFLTDKLRFGQKTGIDLPGERTPDIKHPSDKKRWDGTALQMMSYGYALEVTPLQTLTLYNAVANNGRMMRPMLVREVRSYGETIRRFEPEAISEAIASPASIRAAQQALAGVVEAGTGRLVMKDAAYTAVAKTGTAQQMVRGGGYRTADGGLDILASFTGYYPIENPKYSCIVAIKAHEPQGKRYYGSTLAGPVFRAIADRLYASTISLHNKDYGTARKPAAQSAVKGGRTEAVRAVTQYFSLPYVVTDGNTGWWTPPKSVIAEAGDIQVPSVARPTADTTVLAAGITATEDVGETTAVVPSVAGMGLKDALFLLEESGYRVAFTGMGAVAAQSIKAGTSAPAGMTVYLTLRR